MRTLMQHVKIDNEDGACPLEYKLVKREGAVDHVMQQDTVDPGREATGTIADNETLYVRTLGVHRGRWVMVRPGVKTYKSSKRKATKRKPAKRKPAKRKATKRKTAKRKTAKKRTRAKRR